MYDLFDKNASAWNFGCSSGDTESSNAVRKNESARITNENSVLSHNRSKNKEDNRDISVELEKFLRYRSCIANNREMVAQDMAQSYNELFHATQQPQEFITLEELSPHGRSISTSNNSSNIYTGSQSEGQRHQSHQQQQQQERTYYNLSALSESCTEVYFDEIRHETNCRLPGSDPLAPTATLAPSLSPGSVDIHEQHSTSTNDDSGIKNNRNLISIAHPTIVPIRPNVNNNKKNTINSIPSLILHDSNNDERSVDSRTNENSVERPPKSVIESCSHANRRLNPVIPMQIDTQSSSSSHRTHSHRHHNNNSHQHHHLHTHQGQNHHHHHLRNYQDKTDAPICITSPDPQDENLPESKKRKVSCHDDSDSMDETADDVKSVRTNTDNKKQNHSEIEKRRRDKMNTYITELSAMVPMCHAMSRKLDKLTVLRMAVQHLKTILGAVTSYTEGHFKPTFLSDQELKTLILQAADGFVFVVGCDRGRILYVSESVARTLNYSQDDLLGQSWFDILHPKDVAKVKEQLSSSDLSPREKLIDAKTMLPVKTDVPQGVSRLCSGARRSFFCRMKRKVDSSTSCNESQVKEEVEISPGCHRRKKQQCTDWKYCVIQCTGYLKSWAPAKIGLDEQENEGDGDSCNLSCLVAVGRIQPQLQLYSIDAKTPKLRTIEFVSRHAIDGKILFIDQRATLVLGFLPQELLGTSMYEYYHHDDIPHLAESHKTTLQTSELVTTQMYRFRTKGATFVRLQSGWKSFRNPWTKDIEYLIAKNSAVLCDGRIVESNAQRSDGPNVQGNYDFFAQSNGSLERLISSQVEVSKIGRRIAEEVLDHQRRSEDSSSGESPSPAHEHVLVNTKITATVSPEIMRDSTQSGIGSSDNSSSNPTTNYNQIRNNIALNNSVNDPGSGTGEDMMDIIGSNRMTESPNPLPSDGNDEAAMAVIMSLLEADAGLGGPVDFSGLPWPLP